MTTSFRLPAFTVPVLLIALGFLDSAMAQDDSISVTPTSLSFCVAANNSPAPPAQTLTVTSNTSSTLGFNANAFPSWIRLNGVVTPPSVSGDTLNAPTITVTIDPSAYSGGGATHNGTIQVQSGDTSLVVPVSVTVTSTCRVNATPSTVNLTNDQTFQVVTVGGQAGALITATASYGNNNPSGWFNISRDSLTAGETVTVGLAIGGLPAGTTGSILFKRYGTNDSVSVPVIFNPSGSGNGGFTATPNVVSMNFTGSLQGVMFQTVSITGPIAVVNASINLGTGPSGWLTVLTPQAVTPFTLSVRVNPANLPPGTTTGSVTLVQSGGDGFLIIPVSATVGTLTFGYRPNPFNFSVPAGSGTPQNQTLTINGPNSSQLVATAQVNNGGYQWLTFNGVTTIAGTLTNSTLQLTVSVNPVNLPANQIFTGSIVVNQGNSTILNIPVSVRTFPLTHLRDFTGVGRSGALLYDPVTGTAYTALSNGDGTYQYVYNLFTAAFDTLRTGDFNGDGKSDLVVYNSQTALAYIGMGNGDGTFAFQSLFWGPGYNFVEAGDLNSDGKTDFALYNSATGTMYTGISNGTGGFTYKYTLISTGFTFIRLADFTGDGKADIFLYSAATGAAYFGLGDGSGGFTFSPLFLSPGYDLIDIGDLSGDGKPDIVLYNSATGNAATGISIGVGGFVFTPLIFSPGFTSVRLADHTGDGFADITLYNKTTATAYFGTGTGSGTFGFQSLFWGPGYNYVEPQDVNGDGKFDIVLYNSATSTEYTGVSNGDGTFTYVYQLWGIGRLLAR